MQPHFANPNSRSARFGYSLKPPVFTPPLRRKIPENRQFSITILPPLYVSPQQECFAMRIPIVPQQDPTPAQSVDAAFQALQAYSSAAANSTAPDTGKQSRALLIDSVTQAVNAYYAADTGKHTVDLKDPRYSEAKAQVAAQLETDIARQMATPGAAGTPAQINGLGDVLNALQPGQTDVTAALQQFLPTPGPLLQMPNLVPPSEETPQKIGQTIANLAPVPPSAPGVDEAPHLRSPQID
jgi:hypothetical protein